MDSLSDQLDDEVTDEDEFTWTLGDTFNLVCALISIGCAIVSYLAWRSIP